MPLLGHAAGGDWRFRLARLDGGGEEIVVLLPDSDDLTGRELAAGRKSTRNRATTNLALSLGKRVGIVFERLFEIVHLVAVEASHLGLGELGNVVKVVPCVEHLALGLVVKDEA